MTMFCMHTDVERAFAPTVNQADVLTFDDGHYNVYAARHDLLKLSNRKIIFITPSYVAPDDRPTPDLTEYYQYDRVVNNRSQFMTLSEITELLDLGFELGMHSYAHELVYTKGTTSVDRSWRMHGLTSSPAAMRVLCRFYGTVSALSTPGLVADNGVLRPRTETEFEEFVTSDTQRCVAWFADNLYVPNAYAFPFFTGGELLESTLARYNVTNLYGSRPRP